MSNRYRCGLLLLAVLLFAAADPTRAPLPLRSPVQDKNFYLLSLLARSASVAADDELKGLRDAKASALHAAVAGCKVDVNCFAAAMRFSDDEIARAASALRRMALHDVAAELRRSGTYMLSNAKSDDDLVAAAWLDEARAVNNVIDVYGTGKAPRYPQIDSVSFDVKGQAFGQLVHTVAEDLDEQRAGLRVFFQPSLRFALYLLDVNHRDEAGRREPLEKRDNAAALRRLRGIRWKDYPYTAIVVPGYGPELAGWSFAPQGKLRVEIAARRWKERKAPLIIVSGGYVHPNQTPYCEAVEMKKSLVNDFGVPASAILIEPHARHTTTNLRNAARIMFRDGIPLDRPALVTTDSFHSTYIESEGFAKRCDEELGYQPAAITKRLSPFDLVFTPRIESLQINPIEPLDP